MSIIRIKMRDNGAQECAAFGSFRAFEQAHTTEPGTIEKGVKTMRKFILLGLLAAVFSSPVMAKKTEECDHLLGDDVTKGLWGLCNAYHKAKNPKAQESILAAFDSNAGPGDPPLIPEDPEPPAVECDCWTRADVEYAMENFGSNGCGEFGSFFFASYNDAGATETFIVDLGDEVAIPPGCSYQRLSVFNEIEFSNTANNPENMDVCERDIADMIALCLAPPPE